MSTVFINNVCNDNISVMFPLIILFLTSCIDMEVCTVAVEMVLTGKKKLTAYELPIFGMMTTIMWNYNRHLGKRAGFSACATVPCIHLWKWVKLRQTIHKPVIYPSKHPHLSHISNSFGRTSVNQATNERAGKDPNTNSLISNTFLHPRPVSNCWPPKHLPNKTWYRNWANPS